MRRIYPMHKYGGGVDMRVFAACVENVKIVFRRKS